MRETKYPTSVSSDYGLPAKPPLRRLGLVFGKFYAKWCVHQMINDTYQHFVRTNTVQ